MNFCTDLSQGWISMHLAGDDMRFVSLYVLKLGSKSQKPHPSQPAMGVACVTKLVELSNLVPRPLSLFWERGISDLLFCTLTFVIFLVSACEERDCGLSVLGTGQKNAELLCHASFVLVRGQPPLYLLL